MRILITGSRNYANRSKIMTLIADKLSSLPEGQVLVVVHGGGNSGADMLAARAVRTINSPRLLQEAHPASWSEFGLRAGPIRNKEMVESGVDEVWTFRLEGPSRGTDGCARYARSKGLTAIDFGEKTR